ncbi:MAG: LysR family transcriptional regulator [Oscillospiraceae bacterium]|nr:LysR family transcriptional regulator [Oscillospiraceae bacterium]
MELSQLRYFKALAENGHLTRTAQQLYISAPSLSLSISKLEQELGTPLFDRVKGRLFLNDRGQLLLNAINQGLPAIDSAAGTIKALGASHMNRITIGTTNFTLYNDLISSFMRENPDVYISLRNHPFSQFTKDSLLLQYDFILTNTGTLNNDSMRSDKLFDDELMVVLPEEHPLAQRESVTLSELSGERFIFPTRPINASGPSDYYLSICREAGFEPHVIADCNAYVMTHLFSLRLGIFFTTRRAMEGRPSPGGIVLRVAGVENSADQLSQSIYYDHRRKLSDAAFRFHDFALRFYGKKGEL